MGGKIRFLVKGVSRLPAIAKKGTPSRRCRGDAVNTEKRGIWGRGEFRGRNWGISLCKTPTQKEMGTKKHGSAGHADLQRDAEFQDASKQVSGYHNGKRLKGGGPWLLLDTSVSNQERTKIPWNQS